MPEVVSDKPYRFVSPYRGRWWGEVLKFYLPRYLWRFWGIEHVECRGAERLQESLKAGHGILLAPNHSRECDPFVLGGLSRAVRRPFFAMASWHLFADSGWQAWVLRRIGAFSVYREGMDRAAVNAAIEILVSAERPLVIFPEGVVSRANDRLNPLMEGVAFIARSAAKRRGKATPPGHVVVHPVAIKYRFEGDVRAAVAPVLDDIERRLSWRLSPELGAIERIARIAKALLCLKELEYFGEPQSGELTERQDRLIERILAPLEQEWANGEREAYTIARVKRLRSAILPDLVKGELTEEEISRRWRQLGDCTLAQTLAWYPPDYLTPDSPPDRILETVERFEEDLTGRSRIHRPLSAVIEVGQPIAVELERDRKAAIDPLLEGIETQIKDALGRLLWKNAGTAL